MSSDTPTAKKTGRARAEALSPEQVDRYLRDNPDFFVGRDDLLAELSLPHESGRAISLLERQVTILRERSMESRHALNRLLEHARYNDQLFSITRSLTLALLKKDDMAGVVRAVEDSLLQQENVDACSLILLTGDEDETMVEADAEALAGIRLESASDVAALFPELFRSRHSRCGVFDRERSDFLFPRSEYVIRSCALCPVGGSEVRAVLALGNRSEDYFTRDLDTLFLDFIGEVLGALVFRRG